MNESPASPDARRAPREGRSRWFEPWLVLVVLIGGPALLLAVCRPVPPMLVARLAGDDASARPVAFWAVAWVALVPWAAALVARVTGRGGWRVHVVPAVLAGVFAFAQLGGRRTTREELVARAAAHLPPELDARAVVDALVAGASTGLVGAVVGAFLAASIAPFEWDTWPWWLWALGWPLALVAVGALVV